MKEKSDSIDRLADTIEEVADNYYRYLDKLMFSIEFRIHEILIRIGLSRHSDRSEYFEKFLIANLCILAPILATMGMIGDIFWGNDFLLFAALVFMWPLYLMCFLGMFVPLAYFLLIGIPIKFCRKLRANNTSKNKARCITLLLYFSIFFILIRLN